MKVYDLVVVGGGVSGLSAAITAATEGFSTLVVDGASQFGGQAGSASLIENVIGFPDGVTGKELTAKALQQACKFGVEFLSPFKADDIEFTNNLYKITSEDDVCVYTKSVVLALGLGYKNLDTGSLCRYMGTGISYGSPTPVENFEGKTVTIVGGANSAGQAAVYLAQCDNCKVNLVVRADSIEKSMSAYLVEKVRNYDNIVIHYNAEIAEGQGIDCLENFIINTPEGKVEIPCDRAFILIGAKPKTKWLKNSFLDIPMNEDGFIKTDDNLMVMNGMFAVGDIRTASIKRVASAIGEGARAVNGVRTYLQSLTTTV